MPIAWNRHKFNGSSDAEERQAWYMSVAGEFFRPFTEEGGSTSSSSSDVLKIRPYPNADAAWNCEITMSSVTMSQAGVSSIVLKEITTSRATLSNCIQSGSSSQPLYFDTASFGNIHVLRITKETPQDINTIILLHDPLGRDADTGVGEYYAISAPYKSSFTQANHRVGLIAFLSNTHTGSTYRYSSGSPADIQVVTDNVGLCSNVIINRYAASGILTNLYSIDGMSSTSQTPIADTEFAVSVNDRLTKFYSIGHGLCIRE